MRNSDVPIVITLSFPRNSGRETLLLSGRTDDAVVAEAADIRRRGGLEALFEDAAGDLGHGPLDPLELLLRVLDRDLLAREDVEVALRRGLEPPGLARPHLVE